MVVLIVDDDAAFREVLKSSLQQMGYIAYVAVGLESALEALLQATHRVALVDAHLPYGETQRLLALLRHCGIPVLLFVEREAATGAARPIACQGDLILMKPVGVVELERSVQKLLK
jgi:DNA-binding response OmpR family regulator